MTPLERAARALAKSNTESEHNWLLYVDDARVVLRAIREPSEGMRRAGGFDVDHVADDPLKLAEEIYQAMIDAALSNAATPLPSADAGCCTRHTALSSAVPTRRVLDRPARQAAAAMRGS